MESTTCVLETAFWDTQKTKLILEGRQTGRSNYKTLRAWRVGSETCSQMGMGKDLI